MTQAERILAYLQEGHSITPLEALDKFGCFRLGSRVWDLKREGHDIHTDLIDVGGKRVARYSMNESHESRASVPVGVRWLEGGTTGNSRPPPGEESPRVVSACHPLIADGVQVDARAGTVDHSAVTV